MTELEATVRDLVRHVRALEDELAIFRILAFYGPAVDSGSSAEAAELWTEDGVYDAQIGSWSGQSAIAGMVAGPGHQGLIRGGAAHVMGGVPYIVVEGDQATAVVHYLLHRRDGDHFQVWRATATRWELIRTADGWKVARRTNKLLDGSEEAREFIREGILGKSDHPESDPAVTE